jgi:hypothetical protein
MAKKRITVETTAPEAPPNPLDRGFGIGVRMCCKTIDHEWNFRASDTCDAIEQARVICKDNGFHWPADVIEWDIQQRT